MESAFRFVMPFFALMFPGLSLAQSSVFSLLQTEQTRLATTERAPANFTLFVPDTATQILFNPARASASSSRFLYANYHNALTRPFVSAAYLTREWLLQVDTRVSITDIQRSEIGDTEITGINIWESLRDETSSERDDDLVNTRFRLSNFMQASFGSVAFGFFGVANVNSSETIASSIRDRLTIRGEPVTNARRTLTSNTQTELTDATGYALGAELSFAGSDWDLVSSVGFRRPTAERTVIRRTQNVSNDTTFTSAGPVINFIQFNSAFESRIDEDPALLAVQTYFRKRAWRRDHLFLSLQANYAFDTASTFFLREFELRTEDNPSESSSDTTSVEGEGLFNARYRKVRFELGYVAPRQFHDFYFFLGLHPSLEYERAKHLSDQFIRTRSSMAALTVVDSELIVAALQLPAYFSYAPTSWVKLWGGFNYTYFISIVDREVDSFNQSAGADDNSLQQSLRDTRFDASKSFYLGISLAHKSGFRAHVDLGQDVTDLQRWSLSIGYHF